MISFHHKGDLKRTERFLTRSLNSKYYSILDKYGKLGVTALSAATPVDTGKTASSWSYNIQNGGGVATITWTNSNTKDGYNIAVLIQYGHGTKNGKYVAGRDYINPAMRPVFDKLVEDITREVNKD